jgi:hypothetical protein
MKGLQLEVEDASQGLISEYENENIPDNRFRTRRDLESLGTRALLGRRDVLT